MSYISRTKKNLANALESLKREKLEDGESSIFYQASLIFKSQW